ncbi:MAG TPA: contact-dependent growth inhibition system immunity protein [Acetobacteraceae bacterium]|nr:contact-dependent growth inhibition system immunity protein [Acetobacteraceae bacterium]
MSGFPHLEQFLGAWFHQDFDLDGDVPDVAAKFRQVAQPGEIDAIRSEIQTFLSHAEGDADAAFQQTFAPDIAPSGWNMTAREWLTWVDRLLAE